MAFAISRDLFSLDGLENIYFIASLILNLCFLLFVSIFKLYDKLWRYARIEDFFLAGICSLCANVLFLFITSIFTTNLGARTYLLLAMFSTFFTLVLRLMYRLNKALESKITSSVPKQRMLIVGAGEAASGVLKELSKSPDNEYIPICIIDDDRDKIGRTIAGVKVLGSTYEIPMLCEKYSIDIILFCIAAIDFKDKKRILDICTQTNLEVKIVPSFYRLFTSETPIMPKIRRVEVEDLLGREPVVFDIEKYGQYIINKNILVTGGGGSIGSELCRQIAKLKPKNLVILDIYENSAYNIQQELIRQYGSDINFEIDIASIRDENKLEQLFKEKKFDVVFHAAAHKHVPLMETNPEEAVKNNIFGTINLVELSDKYEVKKFVQISTDKAVNPTNIMGATKRVCEMVVQAKNHSSKTEFVAVRFGNVLGSNGSVIPLFKDQIKAGGPITITHPEIIRYFMTIPEAVSLVLTAGGIAKGGEIFVLDMGEPVKIKDLAENLIRLSGFVPNKDIEIKYTGLRPGEKLYEEILLDEEGITKTNSEKIYIGKPIDVNIDELEKNLRILKNVAEENDKVKVEEMLNIMVPTFKRYKNI